MAGRRSLLLVVLMTLSLASACKKEAPPTAETQPGLNIVWEPMPVPAQAWVNMYRMYTPGGWVLFALPSAPGVALVYIPDSEHAWGLPTASAPKPTMPNEKE